MFAYKTVLLAFCVVAASALPTPVRREVPQEHSHNGIIAVVRTSLAVNNPDNIQDPIFGLLGNAAAIAGAGKITDATCLQQATADQAFTNAKAASDVNGMVNALIYRALERNSGTVGGVTAPCTSITAKNPEIAAIQQHQDPASAGAATVNKNIVLALAQQIAAVGGTPTDALQSGTFSPGNIGDSTGKGNTCDDANDTQGCIFTDKLIVDDATVDEISAAVASGSSSSGAAGASSSTSSAGVGASNSTSSTGSADASGSDCPTVATVTVTAPAQATTSAVAVVNAATTTTAVAAASTGTTAAGQNLQTFTGTLGGAPPPVTPGGRGFEVSGESDDFVGEAAALTRSCSVQHNACANAANAGGQSFSVGDCDKQNTQCTSAITA